MLWGTFITITATNTAEVMGIMGSLVMDLLPLILVFLAVGLAIVLIEAFFSRRRWKKKLWLTG